jgi:hypothetical protein
MELDPRYCDVILKRLEVITGLKRSSRRPVEELVHRDTPLVRNEGKEQQLHPFDRYSLTAESLKIVQEREPVSR